MSDTITPRFEEVPIFRPEDHDHLLELEEAVEAAKKSADKGGLTLDDSPVEDAEAAYAAFYEEAKGRADTIIKVRNVGNKRWREIRRKYPPKPDDAMDSLFGFNTEDAFDEIVAACMISPSFDSDSARDAFIDSIPYGQWGALAMAATRVNQDSRLPKAPTSLSSTSSAT
jgi:hypothetical protein